MKSRLSPLSLGWVRFQHGESLFVLGLFRFGVRGIAVGCSVLWAVEPRDGRPMISALHLMSLGLLKGSDEVCLAPKGWVHSERAGLCCLGIWAQMVCWVMHQRPTWHCRQAVSQPVMVKVDHQCHRSAL